MPPLLSAIPERGDHLEGFRFGARRAIVATYKDGAEAAYSLSFAHEWRERMMALCGCAPFDYPPTCQSAECRRELTKERLLEGYRLADAARFRQLAERFGATQAVVEATAPDPSLLLLYQHDEFRLYQLP